MVCVIFAAQSVHCFFHSTVSHGICVSFYRCQRRVHFNCKGAVIEAYKHNVPADALSSFLQDRVKYRCHFVIYADNSVAVWISVKKLFRFADAELGYIAFNYHIVIEFNAVCVQRSSVCFISLSAFEIDKLSYHHADMLSVLLFNKIINSLSDACFVIVNEIIISVNV